MMAGEEKYEETKKKHLTERVLFLEQTTYPDKSPMAQIEKLDTVAPPRVDKTHLPYRMVKRWVKEEKVRTIVTTRNPKDTMVSYFHFYQNMTGTTDAMLFMCIKK